jgi:hypothetical protein
MAVNIDGNGLIALGGTSTTQGRVRLAEDTDNGTNYIELTAPASVGSDRVITFPDATTTVVGTDTTQTLTNKSIVATQLTGTIAAARLPTGSLLQVVQATSTTGTSTTSTSFVSCGLSASITPSSASNKILVSFSTPVFKNSGNAHGITTIFRGTVAGTNLGDVNWGFGANYASNEECTSVNNGAFLDSPSTTSSQTYTIGFRTNTGVQITAQGNDGMGVITLMEIAA